MLVPPYFQLVPPQYVCSGDGTGSHDRSFNLKMRKNLSKDVIQVWAHMTEISSFASITKIFEVARPNETLVKAETLCLRVHLQL